MASIREKIEHWFELLAGLAFDRPWLIIIFIGALAVALMAQVPDLSLDTSNESFFHESDPTLGIYEDFKAQFGWDELIVIAIEPPEVFDLAFLRKLKALHDDLAANVPHLADITSMVNARNTRGEGDRLIVEDLLEDFPQDEADLAALRARVMSNPLYRSRLISPDGRVTTIVLETEMRAVDTGEQEALAGFDEGPPSAQAAVSRSVLTKNDLVRLVVETVQDIVDRYQADDFKVHLAGSPVVVKDIQRSMVRDMGRFLLLAVLSIGVCLFIIFRRLSGVFLSLLVVSLALVSTLGIMALCGVDFNVPHMILPSFLLAAGVGAAVHVLALVYHHFDRYGGR